MSSPWEALQRRWQWVRPLPKPRYRHGAASVAKTAPPNVYQLPNMLTLEAAATSEEAHEFVIDLLRRLSPSDEIAGQLAYYELCRYQFGSHWRFADLTTALWAATRFVRPETYLEIGVRRGRSAAVVAQCRPDCAIYGFDLWIEQYARVENPGPEFVRRELASLGHRGSVALISGDSKSTVPAFLSEHPDLWFDLITVDGDHSVAGAAADLVSVLPRLKVGGVLAFDDINSVYVLRRVWRDLVKHDGRFLTWEYTDAGHGVALAVRVADEPLASTMRGRGANGANGANG